MNLFLVELLKNVTDFQTEAKCLLDAKSAESIPEASVLQKSLEKGAAFGIELAEVSHLKQVSRHLQTFSARIGFRNADLFFLE